MEGFVLNGLIDFREKRCNVFQFKCLTRNIISYIIFFISINSNLNYKKLNRPSIKNWFLNNLKILPQKNS